MTAGIDVFFTGLMLICFDGQLSCPKGPYAEQHTDKYPNTAWVVRADGKSTPCGRTSPEETRLELTYSPEELNRTDGQVKCEREKVGDRMVCVLADDPLEREICVIPSSGTLARNKLLDEGFRGLPHLDEIDRRFKVLRMEKLKSPYVPTRIYFPDGVVNTGPKWPGADRNQTTPWYRSNGNAGGDLPRDLSDRLSVTYQAETSLSLVVTICGTNQSLIVLEPKLEAKTASVVFRNAAKKPPNPDLVGQFDDLDYLLWYYPLGSWDTPFSGTCPDFPSRDAVLLRCIRDSDKGCAYRPSLQSDSIFWPTVVKP